MSAVKLTAAERGSLRLARYTAPPNTLEDDPAQAAIESAVERIIAARLALIESVLPAHDGGSDMIGHPDGFQHSLALQCDQCDGYPHATCISAHALGVALRVARGVA